MKLFGNKQKKEKNSVKETSTSVVYQTNCIWEQIKTDDDTFMFLGWDNTKQKIISPVSTIQDKKKNQVFRPITNNGVDGAVILPSYAFQYENQISLENEINGFIHKWLDVSDEFKEKASWYIMLTWVKDNLNTIPYLRTLGDYGTGKTRFLDVVGNLCYKPLLVGGAVSKAPIYRMMNTWKGTLVLDEFNLDRSDAKSDIIQILNNGYQKGKPVLRCNQNNSYDIDAFDPFGPKVIATRSRFQDKALESRCLTEIMKETNRSDIPSHLTSEYKKEIDELRNKLLMFRFKTWNKINPDISIGAEFGKVIPRVKQSLTPFMVLFSHDDTRKKNFVYYVENYNRRIVEENANSFEGCIVNSYIELLNEKFSGITTNDILMKMIDTSRCFESTDVRKIGRYMKTLGFDEPLAKKFQGKTIKEVQIEKVKLDRLKQRYVIE